MFRRAKRDRAGQRNQGGFTLIEVVVAVGLLVLVLVALLPEMVVGIRATAGAKNLTQAKGVLQARLEIMRSMPYHVGPLAGNFVDVLDTYYRDSVAPTTTPDCAPSGLVGAPLAGWSGLVPTGSTRCAYEPTTGTFYRKVIPNISAAGLGTFTLVVDTAFLSSTDTGVVAVPPGTGYTSQLVGKDAPPGGSGLLGVWATVVYRQSAALKPVTTYTQISQRTPVDSSLLVNATVDAIRVTSQSPTALMTLDAGVVAQSGERFTGSQVNMNANAASAGMGTGASADGATAALSAPPSDSLGTTTVSLLQSLTPTATDPCQYVCIGSTTVTGALVSASDGLPLSASPGTPVRVTAASEWIQHGTNSSDKYGGFLFNNAPDVAGTGAARGLSSALPMVTMNAKAPVASVESGCESPLVTASQNLFSATGFLVADPIANASPTARACITARTAPIMLFPTAAAPGGIIQVNLGQSSLQCKVIRTAGVRSATATAKFSANVTYWNGTTYASAGTVTETAFNPLISLETSVGGTLKLKDFIQSWRTAQSSDVVVTHENTTANPAGSNVRAKLPGVVFIDSQPTRQGDVNSVVSVTVGTFSCDVKDVR